MDFNTCSRNNHTYSINVFDELTNQGFNYTLDDHVLNIITRIATKVGAPNYVKTPVFQKRNQKPRRNKRKQDVKELTDEEWESFRAFEKTTYKRDDEGINGTINKIRCLLNKLTDSNYTDIYQEITENIDIIKETITDDDMKKISAHIFETASSSKFYSSTYSKLYKDLTEKYDSMKTIFNDTYQSMCNIFDNIETCSEDDYDRFCEINKKNESRKALVSFIINSMKLGLIDNQKPFDLLTHFISMFQEKISENDVKATCEELSEIIFIMVEEGFSVFKDNDEFSDTWEIIVELGDLNVKAYSSLTNKSLFKIMDIIDEFEGEM